MHYYSSLRQSPVQSFSEAMLAGQAPDGGLYMPARFEPLGHAAQRESYAALAARVLTPFVRDAFSARELFSICEQAYDFEPFEEVLDERLVVLRLDTGPSASFKDFGARFLALATAALLRRRGGKLLVLTATSGDTGSAVASAFHRLEQVRVLVLFPAKEISERQRKQMTSLGDNVLAVSVNGTFDQCQALVKRAFREPRLAQYSLSSANSINIGRLLPQMVYYVAAAQRALTRSGAAECDFVVPCGNLGNLVAGLFAAQSGLPVRRFIAATNANDELVPYLREGRYQPIAPSRACLSNAMNVGHPSNLARLVALFGGTMDAAGRLLSQADLQALRACLSVKSVTDEQTLASIREAWRERALLLEPHGAVAYACRELDASPQVPRIVLETAHPAKFPEAIRMAFGDETAPQLALPPSLKGIDEAEEHFLSIEADDEALLALAQSHAGAQ